MLRRRVVNPLAVLLLLTLIVSEVWVAVPWWCYVFVIFGWFLTTVFGSFLVGWDYHLKSLHRNENIVANWISISFDDGPHPKYTPKVLKLLEQNDTA